MIKRCCLQWECERLVRSAERAASVQRAHTALVRDERALPGVPAGARGRRAPFDNSGAATQLASQQTCSSLLAPKPLSPYYRFLEFFFECPLVEVTAMR